MKKKQQKPEIPKEQQREMINAALNKIKTDHKEKGMPKVENPEEGLKDKTNIENKE